MTDGRGIGYVLKTENNIKIWIFTTELNAQTRREFKIEEPTKPLDPVIIQIFILF
mgnify:CR=1 FL=1